MREILLCIQVLLYNNLISFHSCESVMWDVTWSVRKCCCACLLCLGVGLAFIQANCLLHHGMWPVQCCRSTSSCAEKKHKLEFVFSFFKMFYFNWYDSFWFVLIIAGMRTNAAFIFFFCYSCSLKWKPMILWSWILWSQLVDLQRLEIKVFLKVLPAKKKIVAPYCH